MPDAPDLTDAPVAEVLPDLDTDLRDLARRYTQANGALMQLVTLAGGQVESLLERLPKGAQAQVDRGVRTALASAYAAAGRSHRARPAGDAAHRLAAMALGAAGGFGGLPGALLELPVTTTAILRSVQEIAARHGEDIGSEATRLECLRVLGAGGPLAEDDGTDMAFLGARMTLSGAALHGLIARIAPRFAAVLGQKLAAQAVPVIGAAAGATVNLAFSRYYQEMAHVHFGLRRLERHGMADALPAFRAEIEAARRLRKA